MGLWTAPPRPGETVLVTAKKRSGKSWWAWHEVFLRWQGLRIYIDPKATDGYMATHPTVANLRELQSHPARSVLVRPRLGDESFVHAAEEVMAYLLSYKRQHPQPPLLLVVDEAQHFMGKWSWVGGLNTLIQTAAGVNVSVLVINPDYSTIPRQLFHQADHLVLFVDHPIILDYVAERLSSEVPPNVRTHLAKPYHGARFDWHDWFIINPNGSETPVLSNRDSEESVREDEPHREEGHGPSPTNPDGLNDNGRALSTTGDVRSPQSDAMFRPIEGGGR